jgi:sodium/hydrogen antiporter
VGIEWYLVAGALLIGLAVTGKAVERIAITPALIYLAVGIVLGPWVWGIATVDPIANAGVIVRITEAALVVSLVGVGLRLRVPLRDRRWRIPFRLAFPAMALTIGLVAMLAWSLLDVPLGLAIIIGAVLAPTDPVLASEVQVHGPWDRDRVRFSLTGEAGLNDGAAFPFVFLGLGLLGLHELGSAGSKWIAVDLLAEPLGGLAVGGLLGTLIGQTVLLLRKRTGHGVGLDGFLLLGIAAIVFGVAEFTHTSGFFAAFAAGLGLRRIERRETGEADRPADAASDQSAAVHPEHAPAYLAQSLLTRTEEIERLIELGLVVLVGVMLAEADIGIREILLAALLIGVVRPLATVATLLGSGVNPVQLSLLAWFGLRGIGSLFYLTFAIEQGVGGANAQLLVNVTLVTVAASIVIHGLSATPLLARYRARQEARAPEPSRV